MNGKQLVRINRGKFVTLDETYKVEYFSIRGGDSAWIISSRRSHGFYFAVDHAPTFQLARAKFVELVKAVA